MCTPRQDTRSSQRWEEKLYSRKPKCQITPALFKRVTSDYIYYMSAAGSPSVKKTNTITTLATTLAFCPAASFESKPAGPRSNPFKTTGESVFAEEAPEI